MTARRRRIFPKAFIDQFGKELAVNEASSPLRVISGSGLCRHYFIKGFALSFQGRNAIANGRKRIAVFGHFGLAADRTVTRNNNGLVRYHREICLRGLDHSIEASASRIVDEWIVSVPPSVAGVEDISFNKTSRDIAIGVTRTVIFERNGSAIEAERLVGVEYVSRNRAYRRWRKSEVPIFYSRAGGKVFPGIFVSGNSRARGVHPLVAVGVIEVPMRVDQMFDRIGTKIA